MRGRFWISQSLLNLLAFLVVGVFGYGYGIRGDLGGLRGRHLGRGLLLWLAL